MDELRKRYEDLLTGSYDCVDRIVLNAYFSMGHNPGGFRVWWRQLYGGSDEHLDDTHLMRNGGPVRSTGASVRQGNRDPRRRLRPGGPQAPDRRGVPAGAQGWPRR